MRRIAQGAIARDGGESVISADIDEALSDMLFAGGRLNVKLLGGAQEMAEALEAATRRGCVRAYCSSAPRRSGIRSHMVTRSTT
jgi:hypothetical protein